MAKSNLAFSIESIATTAKLTHVGIFRVYCDESYTHHSETDRVYSVAGFIAYAHDWIPFTERWMKLLRPLGLTHFHMSAFEAHEGPFKHMDKQTAFGLLNGLVDVIIDMKPLPFGVIVGVAEFDALPPWAQTIANNPYLQLVETVCRK